MGTLLARVQVAFSTDTSLSMTGSEDMKITLIGPTYPYRGGIAHYTTLLANHLRERHATTLISFRRQYPGFLFPGRTDKDPSREPLTVPCEYLLDPLNPVTWFQTFRRLKELSPDVVVLQWWVSFWSPSFATLGWLIQRSLQTKTVFICHNIIPHEANFLDRSLAVLALSQSEDFIVHSEQDGQRLLEMLPGGRIHQVMFPSYYGVGSVTQDSNEPKTQLGLAENIPVLLFFGFVRKYKGLSILLQALPQILSRMKVHLMIVGEFWEDQGYYNQLVQEWALRPYLTIINEYVPNEAIGQYFAAADVVVLPYIDASQSAIVQLAFGLGKPVIVTDVGGLGELVEHRVTGLVVKPMSPSALAEAIITFFNENLGPTFERNIRSRDPKSGWRRLEQTIESIAQSPRVAKKDDNAS